MGEIDSCPCTFTYCSLGKSPVLQTARQKQRWEINEGYDTVRAGRDCHTVCILNALGLQPVSGSTWETLTCMPNIPFSSIKMTTWCSNALKRMWGSVFIWRNRSVKYQVFATKWPKYFEYYCASLPSLKTLSWRVSLCQSLVVRPLFLRVANS